MSDQIPQGLAAVARAAKDPRITVTTLVAAIEAGTVVPTMKDGKPKVTLAQARSLIEPKTTSTPIKLKRTGRGKSRR